MVFGMNLPNSVEGSSTLKKTSDLLETLQKELSINREVPTKLDEVPSVKVEISINGAKELPCRRKKKSKYQKMKNKNSSKREDNVMPSTYVTFESMPGEALRMTSVCPKSSSPQWNYKCVVDLPLDVFTRDNKQLIFKVWNKCTNTVLQPNIQTDLILGFCAVDVSILIDGSPNVQGWFNIVDFCGKPTGQINLSISPLENVQKYKYYCLYNNSTVTGRTTVNSTPLLSTSSNMMENSGELFSKTLKRKFSELDEITERLRARLSEVVHEDSDDLNDVLMDQFERDINNSEVDDLNLLNFDDEAIKFSNKIFDVKNNLNGSDYDSKMYRIGEENDPKYCKVDAKDSGAGKIKNTDLNMDREKIASNELLAKGGGHIDNLFNKLSLFALDANHTLTPKPTNNSANTSSIERLCNELVSHGIARELKPDSLTSNISADISNSNISSETTSKIISSITTSNITSNVTDISDCKPSLLEN